MEQLFSKDTTAKRLGEIESEITNLKNQYADLREKWEQEKLIIKQIQTSKASIEHLKAEAEQFEKSGDLAKVAEIRYGKILDEEHKVKAANEKLIQIQKSGKLLNEEVNAEDIAEIVSKWTGIPISRMLETERMKLIKMEDRIHQRVISQEEAVAAVANAIRRSRAGLQDENRPIGSFIFLGSTGVGKTELARALAEFLFDDEHSVIRIDMSEYMEKFSVSRLIGAPPGYVGYEEGGQLTEAVRRKPYSVVLLDEFEKAHPDVFNILLQVLDDGRLTDSKSRTVDFKNTIIIMTSNLGTDLINDALINVNDQNRDEIFRGLKFRVTDMLRKKLRPEFLNRIDEIVLFKPLTSKEIRKIAELQIDKLKIRLKNSNIYLEVSNDALDWIAKLGYDTQFGARPLKRAIQKHIADPLALKILASEFISGDSIKVDCSDSGQFMFIKNQ
ncbi:MAG TPA: AAA family ATPase [Candidatus Kapabacteria bacterium]|nr:AAA family ATPase [Candidatus Kapabacteria bacterium]